MNPCPFRKTIDIQVYLHRSSVSLPRSANCLVAGQHSLTSNGQTIEIIPFYLPIQRVARIPASCFGVRLHPPTSLAPLPNNGGLTYRLPYDSRRHCRPMPIILSQVSVLVPCFQRIRSPFWGRNILNIDDLTQPLEIQGHN
jgi:hypothetical protein